MVDNISQTEPVANQWKVALEQDTEDDSDILSDEQPNTRNANNDDGSPNEDEAEGGEEGKEDEEKEPEPQERVYKQSEVSKIQGKLRTKLAEKDNAILTLNNELATLKAENVALKDEVSRIYVDDEGKVDVEKIRQRNIELNKRELAHSQKENALTTKEKAILNREIESSKTAFAKEVAKDYGITDYKKLMECQNPAQMYRVAKSLAGKNPGTAPAGRETFSRPHGPTSSIPAPNVEKLTSDEKIALGLKQKFKRR